MLIFLEKEKMEIEEKKTDVFISYKLLSRKPKQNYIDNSALYIAKLVKLCFCAKFHWKKEYYFILSLFSNK
jgi:hypothetical protein